MSEVQPEDVTWLWDRRIPLGMLSLIEGEPDVGKSTVALDLAARITTGRPMPGEEVGTEPAHVILWAPEDPAAQVIRPRLDAAGADCARVRLITDALTLPDDVERLAELIEVDRARLLIIEPLTGAIGSRTDSYKDHDIRRALMPVVELAARTGAAIVAIRHLRKGDGPAIHRGGGSIAIAALARSVLAVGKDPADDKARVIARTKGNLSMLPPALRYTFVPVGHVARVEWLGESTITADELLTAVDKKKAPVLRQAMDVLQALLKDEPQAAQDVEEQAKVMGVSKSALRRAYTQMGCRATKEPGKDGRWFWRLPIGPVKD